MERRESGAALVIALLVLTFFVAAAMNMLYMAQKKAERAGFKVIGAKATANVDTGSNLGYYELRTAALYVSGDTSLPAPVPGIDFTTNTEYSRPVGGVDFIRLTHWYEYFDSYHFMPAAGGMPTIVRKLWRYPNERSIGGYFINSSFIGQPPGTSSYTNVNQQIDEIRGVDANGVAAVLPESYIINGVPNNKVANVYAEYIKRIRVNGDSGLGIDALRYDFRYFETAIINESAMTVIVGAAPVGLTGGIVTDVLGSVTGDSIIVNRHRD